MNLEIIEKIKRQITSSNELKGLEMTAENLVNMSENVASVMYQDINEAVMQGEKFMVHSCLFTTLSCRDF